MDCGQGMQGTLMLTLHGLAPMSPPHIPRGYGFCGKLIVGVGGLLRDNQIAD